MATPATSRPVDKQAQLAALKAKVTAKVASKMPLQLVPDAPLCLDACSAEDVQATALVAKTAPSDSDWEVPAKKKRAGGANRPGPNPVPRKKKAASRPQPGAYDHIADAAALRALLEERDRTIAGLRNGTINAATGRQLSGEELEKEVEKHRKAITKGLTGQMKWAPALKHGLKAMSLEIVGITEPVFRALMGPELMQKAKVGPKQISVSQASLPGVELYSHIRYSILCCVGGLKIVYNKESRLVKLSGKYGL
ncbi:unnamed protein product [Pedinophyceae sp. YPF-701]|nr:unnamed protein product [Pedinophyceae sp. YPF-701]